ncbi:hypothetical protein [Pseudonocardia spinosispora]|uniref:hypothetical protein n=1 Tax=Pseudonocardia spinosispora TaxID=103441 RepID=UPI000419BDD7|nr:hypothetical protein [Pseudonocardia spinosispora]
MSGPSHSSPQVRRDGASWISTCTIVWNAPKPHNGSAYRAYERWGWRKTATLQPMWDGAPVFDVLMMRLGDTER